ncbi:transposase [Streptomyces sp. MI02-2A]|uniref:transposase n=1 Tax=unclassified Streptomyces TaxID=2593676 RepID=UPI000E25A7F4
MSKRYTAEFKRDAVALVHSSGKTVTEVAREIGVSPEGLLHRALGSRFGIHLTRIPHADKGVGPSAEHGKNGLMLR